MKFIDASRDRWHTLNGEDGPLVTITPSAHSLLTLKQWHGVRHHWPDGMPVGVAIANDSEIEDLAEDLPRLGLVALHFPKWVDGRAYSQARLLRSRFAFAGEVRAVGDVLVDMLPLLQRTGFDAVVMRPDQSADAAERAMRFFPGHYQGDVREPRPLFARPPGEEYVPAEAFNQAGAAI